jgi:hypothetical protein
VATSSDANPLPDIATSRVVSLLAESGLAALTVIPLVAERVSRGAFNPTAVGDDGSSVHATKNPPNNASESDA